MEKINIPASLSNLNQMTKLQSQELNNPINQGLRNSEIQTNKDLEKAKKPNEADEAEGRSVDPDDRKKEKKKQEKKHNQDEKSRHENRGKNSGKFIDFSA